MKTGLGGVEMKTGLDGILGGLVITVSGVDGVARILANIGLKGLVTSFNMLTRGTSLAKNMRGGGGGGGVCGVKSLFSILMSHFLILNCFLFKTFLTTFVTGSFSRPPVRFQKNPKYVRQQQHVKIQAPTIPILC